MGKYVMVMVAAVLLGVGLAGVVNAQNIDWHAQEKALKTQQNVEWKALKVQQHNMKASWKGQHVSSAERARAKHEMERQKRDLRNRQKDARQDLKDRRRANESYMQQHSH